MTRGAGAVSITFSLVNGLRRRWSRATRGPRVDGAPGPGLRKFLFQALVITLASPGKAWGRAYLVATLPGAVRVLRGSGRGHVLVLPGWADDATAGCVSHLIVTWA